jgi:hypothetical protein
MFDLKKPYINILFMMVSYGWSCLYSFTGI